jgi:4-aminobutyrate--pyruvate transaminase
MIASAKALSAAMQPISAVLINERVYQAMLTQSDRLGGFRPRLHLCRPPGGGRRRLETLKIYDEIGHGRPCPRDRADLPEAAGDMVDHPLVGQFRGCGLIGGLEIVADKDTRAIHDKALDVPGRIDRHARERGLILRFVGNRIAFSPPLIITADQVGEIATRLKGALDDTLDELSRG